MPEKRPFLQGCQIHIALTLLTLGKHELLLLDMEGVIKYFQNEKPKKFESDQEAVFSMAFLLKIN